MENNFSIKIGVIIPNILMNADEMEARKSHLLKVCHPNTSIYLIKNSAGPISIESQTELEQAAIEIVKNAALLEKEGFHALIPWCGGDPGIIACRESIKIPIVGPLQSSCAIASTLGYRFGVITPLSKNIKLVEQRIWNLKYHHFLAKVRAIDISVLELRENIPELLKLLTSIIKNMIRKDGADVIITTCMGFYGLSEELMKRVPVPIIDPGWAAVKMAENYVYMSLTHSKETYAFPKNVRNDK